MYIQRSTLLLLFFIYLVLLVGSDWINASGASWYRPLLISFGIIVAAFFLQQRADND